MAKKAGLAHNFYVGGYDLSGDIGSIENAASPRTFLSAPVLDKSAMVRLKGRTDGALDFSTWFDDAALLEHVALSGLPTADVVSIWFLGTTLGDVCGMLSSKQVNYDPTRAEDGSLAIMVNNQGQGVPLEWGKSVTAGKVTFSSAGSKTGEITAQTTSGGVGYIQVFSVGSGTPTFVLQDSSNTTNGIDGDWATLITFATQARGAERKEVSGTVEKALRLTTTGSFANAVCAVGFRRGESVDDVAYA